MNLHAEKPMASAETLTEPDLFRSYWDDGLLDLLFGLALLLTGIGWDTALGPLAVVQVPFWFVLWSPLRRRFVEPRVGFVRFSVARRTRNARGLWSTFALGVGTLALTILVAVTVRGAGAGNELARLIPGLPAVLVAVGAILAGVLTRARRFHAYGLTLIAGAAVSVSLGLGPAPPLVLGGLVAACVGATLLTRFVRASNLYERS